MKNNSEHTNHSSNGFLLGMAMGGALVALFTTQKGREILRELSEKGLSTLENLEERAKEVKIEDPLEEVFEEEMDDTAAPLPAPPQIEHEIENAINPPEDPAHPTTQHKVRRFFKGAKKK